MVEKGKRWCLCGGVGECTYPLGRDGGKERVRLVTFWFEIGAVEVGRVQC